MGGRIAAEFPFLSRGRYASEGSKSLSSSLEQKQRKIYIDTWPIANAIVSSERVNVSIISIDISYCVQTCHLEDLVGRLGNRMRPHLESTKSRAMNTGNPC